MGKVGRWLGEAARSVTGFISLLIGMGSALVFVGAFALFTYGVFSWLKFGVWRSFYMYEFLDFGDSNTGWVGFDWLINSIFSDILTLNVIYGLIGLGFIMGAVAGVLTAIAEPQVNLRGDSH